MSLQFAQIQTSRADSKRVMPTRTGWVQRKCCEGKEDRMQECEDCRKKRVSLQRISTGKEPARVPPIVHDALRSPGQPLEFTTRKFMESHFGHDFSRVHLHTDSLATKSARSINALAYTAGKEIVIDLQHHALTTDARYRLLAHELTHVVQQSSSFGDQTELKMGKREDAAELEADTLSRQVISGQAVNVRERSSKFVQGVSWLSIAAPAAIGAGIGALFGPLGALAGAAIGGVGGLIADVALSGGFSSSSGERWTPQANPDGTCKSAKIDVRATHTGGKGLAAAIVHLLPIYHLFIVYTDQKGAQSYFRAGPDPSGRCPGVNSGSFGVLTSSSGLYTPDSIDWEPGAPSETVLTGSGACGKDSCFLSELARIDGNCVPYDPTGNNSNTVARTLLSKCGVPQRKPVAIAPGWGNPDL